MTGLDLLLFIALFGCGSFSDEAPASTEKNLPLVNKTTDNNYTSAVSPISKQNRPTSTSPTSQFIQTTTTTTTTTASNSKFSKKEFIVCGILIIACAFFLMTTFLLTCTLCKLSRRIRMLSRSARLNSNSNLLEAKKGELQSGGEAKETAVLMSYVSQADQELNSAATEQDGGQAAEDGPKLEDKKGEDSPKTEEAAAAAESSSSPQPQDEAPGSETTPAAPAAAPSSPSSDGTKEPNNQP